eukprot:6174481-Pleurochrysis_carterae.AAC.2
MAKPISVTSAKFHQSLIDAKEATGTAAGLISLRLGTSFHNTRDAHWFYAVSASGQASKHGAYTY